MKKGLKKSEYIFIACLLTTLIALAAINMILPYFHFEFYYVLLLNLALLIAFCGFAVPLGLRIRKRIRNNTRMNLNALKMRETINHGAINDFIFSIYKIQSNFGIQKYSPPHNSIVLLSRLKETGNTNEARNIAEELKLSDNIKTGNLPCSVIKPLFETVFNVLTQFPYMKGGFGFLGSMSELLVHLRSIRNIPPAEIDKVKNYVLSAMASMKIRAIAFQAGHTIGIAINDMIYTNPVYAARDKINLLNEVSNGILPKSCNTFKSVIDHEIGHVFDLVLSVSSSHDLLNLIGNIPAQEIKKELGAYALTDFDNKRELTAVAYADKQNSAKPCCISSKIYELIENSYKKRFSMNSAN